MGCLPYFKFWPGDWLKSSRTRRMTFEERGVFIDLLAYAWDEGGIPADPHHLARLLQISPRRLAKLWPAIEGAWVRTGDVLVNPRMEQVRAEVEEAHLARVEAGRRGGKAKAKAKQC